jgi:polyphosphate glucokinase
MSELRTLGIDVGGTGLKASVLDRNGAMLHDKVWRPTPAGLTPTGLIHELKAMVAGLPDFDRITIGFPGAVRRGKVVTAPHFPDPGWAGFDLAGAVSEAFGRPARLGNDADIQGLGVVSGQGIECVLTLGTGAGTALFENGLLAPHMELAHHPVHGKHDYNGYIGRAALEKVGHKRWNKRVRRVIGILFSLFHYDVLYIGGGNGRRLEGKLDPKVRIVPNEAGITGGVKLWDGLNGTDPGRWSSDAG